MNSIKMGQKRLKPEILDQIKTDQILTGKIARYIKRSLRSMPRIIEQNENGEDDRLTNIGVLEIIVEHNGGTQDIQDLMELQAV